MYEGIIRMSTAIQNVCLGGTMMKSIREAAKTRTRIVTAAAAEFREHGIVATGLADLMRRISMIICAATELQSGNNRDYVAHSINGAAKNLHGWSSVEGE